MKNPNWNNIGSRFLSLQAPGWARFFVCGICMAIILLVLRNNYSTKYGFTDLVCCGANFEPRILDEEKQVPRRIFPGIGFDGQFYAMLAIDPFLTHKNLKNALDLPQYRSRRIFLPLCAFLAGHGNPTLSFNAYAVGNFAFWIGLCILVFYKIRPRSVQEYACALLIIFSSGVFASALLALTDMPSTVLLFAALLLPFFWPVLLCCAVLARETTLIFTPAVLLMEGLQKRKYQSIVLKTAIAMVPVILWYCYCMLRLPEGFFTEKVLGFPFLAMAHRLGSIVHHLPKTLSLFQLRYFLTAISLTTQCAYFALRRRPADPLWLTGAINAFFFILMGHIPWMQWSWMLRYCLPMTFSFNFLMARENQRTFVKWFAMGNIGCIYL